jgi:hypothetical protein
VAGLNQALQRPLVLHPFGQRIANQCDGISRAKFQICGRGHRTGETEKKSSKRHPTQRAIHLHKSLYKTERLATGHRWHPPPMRNDREDRSRQASVIQTQPIDDRNRESLEF